MANNLIPGICGQDGIYVPGSGSCDECDRLAQEFEEARKEAVEAAHDSQEFAGDAQRYANNAANSASSASTYRDQAQNYMGQAKDYRDQAKDYRDEAQQATASVMNYTTKRFIQDFTTSGVTSSLTFAPTGYAYLNTDAYSVYINGLRLNESEYTRSSNVITFNTPITESDQVIEVVVERFIDHSIEIDTTLTQAGKAADAKVVGDRFAVIDGWGLSVVNGKLCITYTA